MMGSPEKLCPNCGTALRYADHAPLIHCDDCGWIPIVEPTPPSGSSPLADPVVRPGSRDEFPPLVPDTAPTIVPIALIEESHDASPTQTVSPRVEGGYRLWLLAAAVCVGLGLVFAVGSRSTGPVTSQRQIAQEFTLRMTAGGARGAELRKAANRGRVAMDDHTAQDVAAALGKSADVAIDSLRQASDISFVQTARVTLISIDIAAAFDPAFLESSLDLRCTLMSKQEDLFAELGELDECRSLICEIDALPEANRLPGSAVRMRRKAAWLIDIESRLSGSQLKP